MVSTNKFNLLHSYIFRKKDVIVNDTFSYKDKSILYICQNGTSGYANAAKGYIYDYISKKIPVKTQYFNCNDIVNENDQFHKYLNSNINNNIEYNTIIIHSTPDIWTTLVKTTPNINLNNKLIIGRTVWEFEKLLPSWVDDINTSIVDIISVPTEWNKQCFIKNGINKPIIVEPHVYIDYPYNKTGLKHLLSKSIILSKNEKNVNLQEYYKFYCIGQFIKRKGIEETIDAFCNAFTSKDKVVLFIKTFKLNYSEEEQTKCTDELIKITNKYDHAPIVYIKENLNYDEIKSLHDVGDCYFHLTRTEGFCLGAFDAFNNNKKVIITGYGGHTEYLGKNYEGFVDYKLTPLGINESLFFEFKLDNTYKWAIPDKNHATFLLSNIIKKETLEVYIDKNFYPKERFHICGNISRWINKSAQIEFGCNLLNEPVILKCINHNYKNTKLRIYTKDDTFEFTIPIGEIDLNFNIKGKHLKIECESSFKPNEIDSNSNDPRVLGIVIVDLSIKSKNLMLSNKFFIDNIKNDINYNISSFNPKFILNKKVGIIGYIPTLSSISNHSSFIKNIYKYKSFADIIFFSEGNWNDNFIKVENPLDVVEKHKDKIGLWTFYHCLRIAKKYNLDYFLMMESDCRVLKDNWDYELFEETIKKDIYCYGSLNINNFNSEPDLLKELTILNKNSHFNFINHGKVGELIPHIWTNGALTVYNTEIFYKFLNDELINILKKWIAWDYDSGELIVNSIGLKESVKKIVHCDKIASNVEDIVPLKYVIENRKNFNAIHPVKTNWNPPILNEYNFYHGGDLGDIIYSLPSIKLVGGGNLFIGNFDFQNETLKCREKFSEEKYNFILPLLKNIDYIKSIHYTDVVDKNIDYNFNEMRYFWNDSDYRELKQVNRLTDAYLDLVGVFSLFNEKESWLTVNKKKISKYIISRSFRYRDEEFPWNDIYKKVNKDSFFIGTSEEHKDFCNKFGYIKHYIVKDALEMAEIINGCELFIGNQSFPCSLAIALNVPVLQEYFNAAKDCIYIRDNFKTKENYKDIL